MDAVIEYAFSLVCGQSVAHTWTPGGIPLPLCQRCTGLYIGAAAAIGLMRLFRPVPDGRFRGLHAALLLLMAPFGFHMVPQGAVLRTMSGYWFGFGLVGLLWLLPGERLSRGRHHENGHGRLHLICASTGLLLLPAFTRLGGRFAAATLPWLAFAGFCGLAALVLANTASLAAKTFEGLRSHYLRGTS